MGQRTRVTSSQLKGRNADLDDLGAFREHRRGGSNSEYSAGRSRLKRQSRSVTIAGRGPARDPPFCCGLCFPDRAVRSAQIGLFCKLLAGVFLHRRRGHELLEGGLELAFASVARCRSRMTAHLRRSGTRPRSPARRSAAGYGCGIVIGERPLRQPSAELLGQCDDDALGAADITQPVASCC